MFYNDFLITVVKDYYNYGVFILTPIKCVHYLKKAMVQSVK